MHNDNNNRPFDLPRISGDEANTVPTPEPQQPVQPVQEPVTTPTPENTFFQPTQLTQEEAKTPEEKPIIEIPQEYYDKLEEERKEKEKKDEEKRINAENTKELGVLSGKLLTLIVLNAAIIFICLLGTVKIVKYTLFVIPIFIVLMAISDSLKDGKDSNYPLSVLIGGMIVAVITFVISTVKEETMDLWTYYAISAAVAAFAGLIVSNIINKIITRRDEIKALETMGYIIFFAAIIGVPVFLFNKYPVEFNRIVFRTIGEVKAESEEEYVYKTLKNRYNIDFTCSNDVKMHIDYGNKITRSRKCTTSVFPKKEFEVYSTAYDESKNQYIVFDNILDLVFFKPYEEQLNSELLTLTAAKQVVVLFYPEEGCLFVGDCANIEDYRKNIQKEEDPDNQFKKSSTLDLSKYTSNYDSVKFINEGKYKVVVRVTGKFYSMEEYEDVVSKTEDYLNQTGLDNNFGYIIIVQSYDPLKNHEKTEYEVEGKATSDKKFTGAEITYDGD